MVILPVLFSILHGAGTMVYGVSWVFLPSHIFPQLVSTGAESMIMNLTNLRHLLRCQTPMCAHDYF